MKTKMVELLPLDSVPINLNITCSLELPTMIISCNWKCMCDIFSRGGVFNGVSRWDTTILEASTSTTEIKLSA